MTNTSRINQSNHDRNHSYDQGVVTTWEVTCPLYWQIAQESKKGDAPHIHDVAVFL
jgi:hypothetical protein